MRRTGRPRWFSAASGVREHGGGQETVYHRTVDKTASNLIGYFHFMSTRHALHDLLCSDRIPTTLALWAVQFLRM